MAFLDTLAQIEAEPDGQTKYRQTMKMLLSKAVRQEVEDYLAVFGLAAPRDVLAVVMLALNFTFILGRDPKDMLCRFEATQFYPKFVEAFKARADPTMHVTRALDAFRAWKEGGQDDVRVFSQDQITQRRLYDEPYSPYLEKIYIDAGGDAALLTALIDGPVRRTAPPPAPPSRENVTQLFHAAAASFDHPFVQEFIRLRAPKGPTEAPGAYLEFLAALLSKFEERTVAPTMDSIGTSIGR